MGLASAIIASCVAGIFVGLLWMNISLSRIAGLLERIEKQGRK